MLIHAIVATEPEHHDAWSEVEHDLRETIALGTGRDPRAVQVVIVKEAPSTRTGTVSIQGPVSDEVRAAITTLVRDAIDVAWAADAVPTGQTATMLATICQRLNLATAEAVALGAEWHALVEREIALYHRVERLNTTMQALIRADDQFDPDTFDPKTFWPSDSFVWVSDPDDGEEAVAVPTRPVWQGIVSNETGGWLDGLYRDLMRARSAWSDILTPEMQQIGERRTAATNLRNHLSRAKTAYEAIG